MKTVAFVPMKLNNERLPGKNTKPFTNGQPLCRYIMETLLRVEGIDGGVYAYCSDPAVCEFLPAGVEFLRRDPWLDGPQAGILDISLAFARDVRAEIHVMAHATAPFMTAESVAKGVNAIAREGHDSAMPVLRLQEFLWMNGKPLNYDPASVPRLQDMPPLLMETCGYFAYTDRLIREHKRRVGFNPKLIEVTKVEAIDIDYPMDFEIADAVNNHLQRTQAYESRPSSKPLRPEEYL